MFLLLLLLHLLDEQREFILPDGGCFCLIVCLCVMFDGCDVYASYLHVYLWKCFIKNISCITSAFFGRLIVFPLQFLVGKQ